MGDVGSRFLAVYKQKRELEEFVCLSLCWIDLRIIADKENILSGKLFHLSLNFTVNVILRLSV